MKPVSIDVQKADILSKFDSKKYIHTYRNKCVLKRGDVVILDEKLVQNPSFYRRLIRVDNGNGTDITICIPFSPIKYSLRIGPGRNASIRNRFQADRKVD